MEGMALEAPAFLRKASAERDAAYDSAFSKVYQTYYTRVFAFVYSRVRDVELTKDLVSEAFERAYVKGHCVREEAAYGAWLFMVAKNLIAGHYRRQKREFNYQDKVKDALRFADQPLEPEEFTLRDERISNLMRHVRALPKRDQELISLRFDAELSHVEIAQITGMTPLNVRVTLFRALKRLRARMEGEKTQ